MPGSYPDPRSYANSAIQILEEAYEESQGSYAGTLILKAIDVISLLKEEIRESGQRRLFESDSYEFNDSNSAVLSCIDASGRVPAGSSGVPVPAAHRLPQNNLSP